MKIRPGGGGPLFTEAAQYLVNERVTLKDLRAKLKALQEEISHAQARYDRASEALYNSVIGEHVPDERAFRVSGDRIVFVHKGHDGTKDRQPNILVAGLEGPE